MKNLPIHPHAQHLNTLAVMPGLVRMSYLCLTPLQAQAFLPKEANGPKKGEAILINRPSPDNQTVALLRITRLPIVDSNPCRFAVEFFREG